MILNKVLDALDLHKTGFITGDEILPSRFAVTELAASSIGAVGCSVAHLLKSLNLVGELSTCRVDRRLASLWFGQSIQPVNWEMPPLWDAIAGDYEASNGWIKLHTNLSHHRKAALSVLKCDADRGKVTHAIKSWDVNELESQIVDAGGVAAAMRTRGQWAFHPQGRAVASEPLICWSEPRENLIRPWQPSNKRPLAGLRVLDLTRVLAGPVATRTLAGFGASVLRIDPYGWDEANVVPDITIGKRCAFLDLNDQSDRDKFVDLLEQAHVLVHGYRPEALDGLGFDRDTRMKIAPHVIEVSLNAYGQTGPWRNRRGFDSLVQMSSGIAAAGMEWANKNKPHPLPVQALDHATGYLMAAAVVRALDSAVNGKGIADAHLSLARTAKLLTEHEQIELGTLNMEAKASDYSAEIEVTPWGDARRLKPPLLIEGTPLDWSRPAGELGSSVAAFFVDN